MEESILNNIKKLLNIGEDNTPFDTDVRIHINTAFMALNQIGLTPEHGFSITGPEEKWSDLLVDETRLEAVKTYVYLRVRLLFDPPAHAFLLDSLQEQLKEMYWRLSVMREYTVFPTEDPPADAEVDGGGPIPSPLRQKTFDGGHP